MSDSNKGDVKVMLQLTTIQNLNMWIKLNI